MKKIIVLSLLIGWFCTTVNAQKNILLPKAYAFSRQVLGGKKPTNIPDENGNTIKNVTNPSVQYFIYVVARQGSNLVLKNIWIKGQQYAATQLKELSPVVISNASMPGNDHDTLIAATKNTVWRIQVKEVKKTVTISNTLEQFLHKNELVIEYRDKVKSGTLPVKEIKKLSDIALQ
jgi:hypothetical protein